MSLRLKTIIGVALIEAILLAFLIFTVMRYMHDSAEEALLKRAYTTAALFTSTAKDPVLAFDLASLDTFSRELKSNPDIEYVRTQTTDGIVLSSAGAPDILDKVFVEDTSLDTVSDGIFDTSALISEGGVDYAKVEIGFNIDQIESTLAETRRLTTFIAAIEMLLVAIFSLMLGTYLTRQLIVLQSAAKSISQGDFSHKLEIRSKDEVAEVAIAFNQMSGALLESRSARDNVERELIELNRTLELRVDQRTEKINDQMEEIKVAHEKLAEAQAKLLQTEKLASIGQLSAGIAHEINNPIAFVQSNINTLQEYIGLYQKLFQLYRSSYDSTTDEQAKIRKSIAELEKQEDLPFVNSDIDSLITDTIDGAQRVQDIVKGLKEFSHVGSDEKTPCDLVSCVESTLKIVKNELSKNCVIETVLEPVPMVLANRGELNQVLVNLLINAGQSVELDGLVTIKTYQKNENVIIAVSDNGIGIEQSDINKLFEPFYTTKPIGVGTGLGLAISYGIVKNHGGDIHVESTPGEGTTFSLELPAYTEILGAHAA